MNMGELPPDRCGYTWPEDFENGDYQYHQSCCWRETINGSQYCAWHADRNEVSKSVEALREVRVPPELREKIYRAPRVESEILDPIHNSTKSYHFVELLDGSDLSGVELEKKVPFRSVTLRESDFSGANLNGSDFSNAILVGADLSDATLKNAKLSGTRLTGVDLSNADLKNADLSGANLNGADLSGADLTGADLSGADLTGADLSDADLMHVDLSGANLGGVDLSGESLDTADLSGAYLFGGDLSGAYLVKTDLSGANLGEADLSDTKLKGADLSAANLEHAALIRTNLFDANLTDSLPHGATFTDVQINDDTQIRSAENQKIDAQIWQRGPLSPLMRCGYDPERGRNHWMEFVPGIRFLYQRIIDDSERDTDQLSKAADTYQTFEKLGRENAHPTLQSEMFVLRQDMQRKRHWYNGEYLKWAFARTSRAVFKHGESLGRIVASALMIIIMYATIYTQFDLIVDANGQFVRDPVGALYFSTLTFTTLGLGDFQPSPAKEFARLLVTSQAAIGAILIAIFVFVLGRRAAK